MRRLLLPLIAGSIVLAIIVAAIVVAARRGFGVAHAQHDGDEDQYDEHRDDLTEIRIRQADRRALGDLGDALERTLYDYSGAIRWNNFEVAWDMVDPKVRAEHPLTDIDFSRYKQVQISGYRDLTTSGGPDGTVERAVELRVINKHTMAERTMRYRERWRWDPEAKRWWLVVGLPDLWNGE